MGRFPEPTFILGPAPAAFTLVPYVHSQDAALADARQTLREAFQAASAGSEPNV